MVNDQVEPAARGKVVSARVNQELYLRASGVSTLALLRIGLGKVQPAHTPSQVGELVDSDPDVVAKKKELLLARLEREIAEARAPLDVTSRMDALEEWLVGVMASGC